MSTQPVNPSSSGFARKLLPYLLLFLVVAGGGWFWWQRQQPDAQAVAAAETRMWQAYYAADPLRLHGELMALLQAQFHLPASEANAVAQSLAMAAYKFETSDGNYEALVLPDLERAYGQLRTALKRPFDPGKAARAELAWWIARRTPGQDSAQQVGTKIGELYAIVYGAERPGFIEAGVLRAEAGRLRDSGGAHCDWQQVEALLQRSYQTLVKAI